ncbi:MAG: DUF5667 domain-containing protein, partial [Dehalococcoidales bacterium]|nr:DUF5667 domain-containing protein [Dehalococcoidales bacterium]
EQAADLEPLLRTALHAKIASNVQPRAEFKARARYEFQSALRDMEMKKSRQRSFLSWIWQRQPGWSLAVVAVVVMVLSGGGVVAASSFSMPDDPLYSVKLASEKVQLSVTPSDLGKAELNNKFADRRTEEIVYMASKGDPQEVQITAQLLNTNLENISSNLAGGRDRPEPSGNNADLPAQPDTGLPDDKSMVQEPALGVASAPGVAADASAEVLQAVPFSAPQPSPESSMPAASRAVPDTVLPDTNLDSVERGLAASRFNAPEVSVQNWSIHGGPGYSNLPTNITQSEDWEILKKIIDSHWARLSDLEKALDNAPPEVRPAIRDAIAKSLNEYDRSVSNMSQSAR